jgi:2-oxoglutarate ferredoxin oxidoreductase subunit alpha
MSEGLGMTGMTETPVVVMVGQRPGPSTGLPTYTAQGDLHFVIHASQGEFPRIVIAPGNVDECFYETARAFNWAEKYQLPVILLTDKHVLESEVSVEPFDVDRVKVERGLLIEEQYKDEGEYDRYEVTETGVSPRAIPSAKNAIVHVNSDEHNEEGITSEDPLVATTMTDKRMRKLHAIKQEMEERDVETVKFYGPKEAEATVVSWGSTKGPIREAMRRLNAEGNILNYLQVLYLQPFPKTKVEQALGKAQTTVVVEHNSTSQLAGLIRDHTLRNVDHKILKYDGRPFNPIELANRIKEVL